MYSFTLMIDCIMLTYCQQSLRGFIEENPFSYRFEMVDFLAEEYDVNVSVDTISRILKKESISRKKV